MKKTLRTSKSSASYAALSRAEKQLKNTAGKKMSAKAHFTNGVTVSGQWKLPRSKNIGNCSRKMPV